jgi:thymidine kinase
MVENIAPTFHGSIELIIGPMFAGKTTELLRRVQRHAISGKSCLYIKYAADTRYDISCIATHDQ